jgi:hypothetical protein
MMKEPVVTIAGKQLAPGWLFLAIVLLYVLLVSWYSWLTPPFEGPDEPQHFAYVEWLAEGKGFPPQGEAAWETDIEQEAGQPPLYYLIASIPARLIGVTNPRAIYRENPHFPGAFPRLHWVDQSPLSFARDNDNNAIHYPSDAQPLQGGWLALYAARVVSLAFGVLLLASVYGLGRQVAPERPGLALTATALVAVTPQVIFISSVASNDIPAAALSSLTLWLLAVVVREGPTWPRSLGVGLAFGLAIMTKVSTIALALPIGAALLWLWLSGRESLAQTIHIGLMMVLGAVLVAGWWFIRSLILYGSPLGMETHDRTPWAIGTGPEGYLAPFSARWQDVFRSFWISLGWGLIRPAPWLYQVLSVPTWAGLGGLLLAIYRWWTRGGRRLTAMAILLILSLLAIIGVAVGLEIWMRRVVASYGRLMFPAVAAIAVLLVFGWRAIHRKLDKIMVALVGLISLAAPIWLLGPAFSLPITVTASDDLDSIGLFFGPAEAPITELISANVLIDSSEEGVPVPVELCWRVLRQSERPVSVLVHFIGPDNLLGANHRSYPGMGSYATTFWQPGQTFCDVMPVLIYKRSLPETYLYKVEVTMLDLQLEERLPIFDSAGNQVDFAVIDEVQLLIGEEREERIAYDPDQGADSPPFQLISYELDNVWRQGEANPVMLNWGINRAIDQDYQVFVHLRDAGSDEVVAQGDGPPAGGWHPTSWWKLGLGVADEHRVDVPDSVPPGEYHLVVGFYDLASGARFGPEYDLGPVIVVE